MLSGSGAGDYRYVIDALAAAVFLLPADETPVTPEPTPVPAPRLAEVYAGEAKIRPDMKVVFLQVWKTPVERLMGTTEILRQLANLAENKKAA